MGWLARLTGREQKAASADPLAIWAEIFGGRSSRAGVSVSWKTALECSVSLACTRVIAEGLAQVPLKLHRAMPNGGSVPATDHPLYDVLATKPNELQTSFEFRESALFHTVLAGGAYAFKNVVRGRVVELIQFTPQNVSVKRRTEGRPDYQVTFPDGSRRTFAGEMIWHLRGPSWNDYQGLEGIALAREAIGLAVAAEEASSSLHRNGVNPGGVYSVEGTLTPEQHQALLNFIKKNYAGADNTGVPMVLDRNAKFLSMAMKMTDAQHMETRRFQVEEVCRVFRVLPIMVGFSDKTATYASAEQMFLAHVVHTLQPWATRIEQSIDANLLSPADRKAGLYSRFNLNALLRGATKDRAELYAKAIMNGWMTRNEVRALEELNPLDGLDEPLKPANTLAGDAPDPAGPDPAPSPVN